MKLIDPKITILFNENGLWLEMRDSPSGVPFLEVQLTPEQTRLALSRCSHTACDAEVRGLERVGLHCETAPFVFAFDDSDIECKEHRKAAADFAESIAPEGWTVDRYFGSQGSFFQVDGVRYARTWLRRYVAEKDAEFGLRRFGVVFPEREAEPQSKRRKSKSAK